MEEKCARDKPCSAQRKQPYKRPGFPASTEKDRQQVLLIQSAPPREVCLYDGIRRDRTGLTFVATKAFCRDGPGKAVPGFRSTWNDFCGVEQERTRSKRRTLAEGCYIGKSLSSVRSRQPRSHRTRDDICGAGQEPDDTQIGSVSSVRPSRSSVRPRLSKEQQNSGRQAGSQVGSLPSERGSQGLAELGTTAATAKARVSLPSAWELLKTGVFGTTEDIGTVHGSEKGERGGNQRLPTPWM